MASKTGPQVATDYSAASLLVARFGQVFVQRIGWIRQLAGSAHRSQIIFVRDSTIEAHLIILARSPGMRPGEPMRAESRQEPLEELDCHSLITCSKRRVPCMSTIPGRECSFCA
jgi:hypothetical protein